MAYLRKHLVSLLQRICGFALIGVLQIVITTVSVQAGGFPEADKDVEHELILLAAPPFGYINNLEHVKFSVNVLKRPEDVVDTVRLVQTDAEGNPIAEADVMSDDGRNGDYKAKDWEYTLTLTFNEPVPITRYYQAVVNLKNDSRQILSQVRKFQVTKEPYSKDPDEDKMVYGMGAPFPVNRVVMRLVEGEEKTTAKALADSVGGSVVGYAPIINQYSLEVPATTVEELEAIIEKLRADPRVAGVMKSIEVQLE